jgi:hypothetical protein
MWQICPNLLTMIGERATRPVERLQRQEDRQKMVRQICLTILAGVGKRATRPALTFRQICLNVRRAQGCT